MKNLRFTARGLVPMLGAILTIGTVSVNSANAAIVSSTHTRVIHYKCGMNDYNRDGYPFTADLQLKIHPNGIVDGTWKSDSIRPDPANGIVEFISGGITGKYIHFSVGARGTLSVRGEFANNDVHQITGSAYLHHRRLTFSAQQEK